VNGDGFRTDEFRDHIKTIIKEERDLINHFSYQSDFADSPTWSVSYSDLTKLIELDHVDNIIKHPEEAIDLIHDVLDEFNESDDEESSFRLNGLPDSKIFEIRQLRASEIGKYIGVNGLVKRTSKVEGYIKKGVYECQRCGAKTSNEVVNNKLTEPTECSGCGKTTSKTTFKRLDKESKKTNFMEVEVQEPPEALEGREQPQKLKIQIMGNILNDRNLKAGDHIKAYGILKSSQRSKKSPVIEVFLDMKDFDKIDKEYEELELTEEEEKKMKELSEDPNIFKRIVKSVCPSIKGLTRPKKGIALQLFGGVKRDYPDQTVRGDIHILLVGDPGTGKSQLARFVSKTSPRGQFSSGKGSTAAGLTAAAVKESSPIDNSQSWALKAGALPLADGGIAAIDEIEKTPEGVRNSLHEALEQQKINVHKAGINTELNARCGVLACCNPEYGRFEPNESFRDQIDLGFPMLSRFDLIFKITDRPDKQRDSDIAMHMLNLRSGETNYEDIIDQETLRLYIKKAKEIEPDLTSEAKQEIHDYYVNMRQESGPDGVTMTARQLEGLSRLAEASARTRLSDEVTKKDSQRAIQIMDYYIKETLDKDIDLVNSDYSSEERSIRKMIIDTINDLRPEYPEGVKEEIIIDQVDEDADKVEKELDRMRTNGEVFTPKQGKYKLS